MGFGKNAFAVDKPTCLDLLNPRQRLFYNPLLFKSGNLEDPVLLPVANGPEYCAMKSFRPYAKPAASNLPASSHGYSSASSSSTSIPRRIRREIHGRTNP